MLEGGGPQAPRRSRPRAPAPAPQPFPLPEPSQPILPSVLSLLGLPTPGPPHSDGSFITFWGQTHTFLLPQPSPQGALPSPGTPSRPPCLGPPVAASAVCQVCECDGALPPFGWRDSQGIYGELRELCGGFLGWGQGGWILWTLGGRTSLELNLSFSLQVPLPHQLPPKPP